MAEVRCPMCGKSNPAERETCQFCQARIIPLSAPPPSPEDLFDPDKGAEEEVPDWLTSLRGKDDEDVADLDLGNVPDEPEEGSDFDWPSSNDEQTAESEPGEEEGETPDWLSRMRSELPSGPVEEQNEDEGENIEEPDWLHKVRARKEEEEEREAGFEDEAGEEEFSFELEEDLESAPGDSAEPEYPDMPNWFVEPSDEAEGPAEQVQASPMPDFWMESEAEDGQEKEQAIPSWDAAPESDLQADEEQLPGWMSLDTGETEESFAEEQAEEDLENQDRGESEAGLFSEELPDWIKNVPVQAEEAEQLGKEEAEADITAAEVPSWLEAMRPVDALQDQAVVTNGEAPGVGPLAGMSGVLPAGVEISPERKPPAYPTRIQVTDTQKAHADLLEQLVKTEGEARALPGRPVILSQHVLRIAIFLILLVAIGFPMVMGIPDVATPVFSPEVGEVGQLVEALAPGAPVLLAVDYEPGLSSEMNTALIPVVDHLMVKGAYLALVSTSPTGPLQAERLLEIANRGGGHQYTTADHYANLGFIPGGPVGLLSFAQAPRLVMPEAYDHPDVWQATALQNVSSLKDFSMLVVATENPDSARAWIEQVQPLLGETALIMVVSAQAEPLVRPYFGGASSQVQGLVVGLSGGAAYESLTGRTGSAHLFWSPFSLGIVTAGLLILVGGIINAVAALLANNRENTEREASS